MTKPPLTWCEVLEDEYRALYGAAPLSDAAPDDPDQRLRSLHRRIHERGPSAVCLSGGGIRSATFGLGVLQGLAHVGVLGSIDYLSTVSGGGYIGGWFTAWLKREGPAGREGVLRAMDPERAMHGTVRGHEKDEASPVDRVRRTCRYLAPRGGLVSADVWALVTTMTRNLVLNWLVILPLIGAALMIPRVYYAATQLVAQPLLPPGSALPCSVRGDASEVSLLIAIASFVISTLYAVLNLVGLGGRWTEGHFLGWGLLPALVGAVALTFFWSAYPCTSDVGRSMLVSAIIPPAGWILVGALATRLRKRGVPDAGSTLRVRVGIRTVLASLAAGPILGAGVVWFESFQYGFGESESLRELYAVFAVPALFALGLVQLTVFIGLASRELDDAVLEWYSRAAAWIAIAAVAWMAAGVLVFYLADAVELGIGAASRALSIGRAGPSVVVLTLMPLISSLAGLSSKAGDGTGPRAWGRLALQKLALPAIIIALLSTIAWALMRAVEMMEYHGLGDAGRAPHARGAGVGENLMLGAALLALGLVMSRFVPVNRFSLHGMYRQRLVRTFLGASRRDRDPNGFTGFDARDDLRVHELGEVRPLHVINTTLNAVSSTHVGRHETKAQSFTFTPLHVGSHELGYRPAHEFGSDGGGRGTGISLGLALAVSGAAASPAMGRLSSKASAFLMTLANARLGLWFGNPRSDTTWRRSEPLVGVAPLVRELLGLTTDRNPYVYLSDGGHYENLALWEMVARRCRFIIVSDAGEDANYTFDDLANAVRRIRLDLAIPIEFDPIGLTRSGQGHARAAIGRIRYSVVDGAGVPDGTILLLKSTLCGDEPVDVRNFASGDPTFPHTSTTNQFFDEARFESYRTLGFHTVMSVASASALEPVRTAAALCDSARARLAAKAG